MHEHPDYDVLTQSVLDYNERALDGRVNQVDLAAVERVMSQGGDLLNAASGLMESTASMMDVSRDVFVSAMSTYRTIRELDHITELHHAQSRASLEKLKLKLPAIEKQIDRIMGSAERMMDRVFDVDASQCTMDQLRQRDRLLEHATRMSEQANVILLRFMSL